MKMMETEHLKKALEGAVAAFLAKYEADQKAESEDFAADAEEAEKAGESFVEPDSEFPDDRTEEEWWEDFTEFVAHQGLGHWCSEAPDYEAPL
jgi:hypothetical protein